MLSEERRAFVKRGAALSAALACGRALSAPLAQESVSQLAPCQWVSWEGFCQAFLQQDGRVVDHTGGGHSTSEGQVYALFFALLSADRQRFDCILEWTKNNLAAGDLTGRLMAWKWGKTANGQWTVIDQNAASDADLWLAYTLFQAGRIWQDSRLSSMAHLIADRISNELVVNVKGLGTLLLPGKEGFQFKGDRYKLNPSYLPLFLLRGMESEQPKGPWGALIRSTVEILDKTTPKGLVADWVGASAKKGFFNFAGRECVGSYDAIRVYLWMALTSRSDSNRSYLLKKFQGYSGLVTTQGLPPERLDACTGKTENTGPVGFSIAIMPFLQEIGATSAIERQNLRLAATGGVPKVYYEQALALFSQLWLEQRYEFGVDGRLNIRNIRSCLN